jgi:hypothetical protein
MCYKNPLATVVIKLADVANVSHTTVSAFFINSSKLLAMKYTANSRMVGHLIDYLPCYHQLAPFGIVVG